MRKAAIPAHPYQGERVVSTKVGPEFHRRLREFSVGRDASVSTIIKTAIFEYMQRNEKPRIEA